MNESHHKWSSPPYLDYSPFTYIGILPAYYNNNKVYSTYGLCLSQCVRNSKSPPVPLTIIRPMNEWLSVVELRL